MKARLVAAQGTQAQQPKGWAHKHRWKPRRPRGSCRAGLGMAGPCPPHRAMPISLQLFTPNPTAPRLAERQPVGKWTPRTGPVPSSAHLLGETSWMPTCPLHLLLLPAPMPTPSPNPSAPLGALLEPLVTTSLWHHQHGHQVISRNFNESVSSLSPTLRQERRLSWNSDTWLPRDPPPTPACGQARAPDAGPRAARRHPATEPRGRSCLAPSRSPTRQLRRLSVPECQTSTSVRGCLGIQSNCRHGRKKEQ